MRERRGEEPSREERREQEEGERRRRKTLDSVSTHPHDREAPDVWVVPLPLGYTPSHDQRFPQLPSLPDGVLETVFRGTLHRATV